MNNIKWTFLSNHGRVICYLAKNPRCTIESLARDADLSIPGVHKIIDDLEEGGYVVRQKIGRCNQYLVHPELPMRHHLEWDHSVADILLPLKQVQSNKNYPAKKSQITMDKFRPAKIDGERQTVCR